jgi:hypothetical protein
MIVLDEQLKDVVIREDIERWHRGAVIFVNELRPNTTIKDDGIAALLRTADEPTFVTINVSDFWRRIDGDEHYRVVCFDLSTDQVTEIPSRLRQILKLRPFATRRARLGKVILVRPESILWYVDRNQRAERIREES